MNDFHIKFADKKKVFLTSFELHDIYSGLLAGTKHDLTEHLLENYRNSLPEGTYFKLDDECFVPNTGLSQEEWLAERKFRPYKYCLKVRDSFCECRLMVYWIDFAPPQDMSLHDYIEKHTSDINFEDYAEVIDW